MKMTAIFELDEKDIKEAIELWLNYTNYGGDEDKRYKVELSKKNITATAQEILELEEEKYEF